MQSRRPGRWSIRAERAHQPAHPVRAPAAGDRKQADALIAADGRWHDPIPERGAMLNGAQPTWCSCSTCDNTLLDNDRLQRRSARRISPASSAPQPRSLLGDFRGAARRAGLRRLPRRVAALPARRDERSAPAADVRVSGGLSVCRAALSRRARARSRIFAVGAPTVILSDGDVVFQPRKIQRSGLWEAVEGRVLIYIHKEQMLDDVEQRYPAAPLRHGGRQAAHSGGDEGDLGATG